MRLIKLDLLSVINRKMPPLHTACNGGKLFYSFGGKMVAKLRYNSLQFVIIAILQYHCKPLFLLYLF